MPMDMHPGTREGVLEQILKRILGQEDNNDHWHDGYQRGMVMVEGHTNEDADDACGVLAERVRNVYVRRGSPYELSVIRCERPPGRRRYEFGPEHARRILKACSIERTAPFGAVYTLYNGLNPTWVPKVPQQVGSVGDLYSC